MRRERLRSFATLDEPRRAVSVGRPQPTSLPASLGIVDAAIESLGVEAQWIGYAQHHHAAIGIGDQAVVEVAGRHGHIIAEAEDVVLVHPGVVTRFRAVISDALEAGSRISIEGPPFRTVIAGGFGAIQGPFAFAAVKAAEMAAGKRYPHDAFRIDIAAANAKARRWHIVNLCERRF